MKVIHQDFFKIFYDNTDSSGFTYHTSYLSLAERARSNMLNEYFPEVVEMLKKNSFFFVVKQLKVKFIQPSYLFDQLKINTGLKDNTYTSISLTQKIVNKNISICEIDVQLVWIDGKTNKPSRLPSNIISRFKSMEVV